MHPTPSMSGRSESRAVQNWRRLASRIRSLVGVRRASPSSLSTYQIRRQLNRQPKAEKKAFDLATSNKNFIAVGTFVLLNNVPLGTEVYQRIGRKVYMKSIRIRGTIFNIGTDGQDDGRILLVYDQQPNGVQPIIQDIIQDSTAAALSSFRSNPNLNNRERFQVLRDHTIHFPATTNTGGVITNQAFPDTEHKSYNIDWFVNLHGKEVLYNGVNGGTIADITSGSLYLIVLGYLSDNLWTLSSSSRLRYYD